MNNQKLAAIAKLSEIKSGEMKEVESDGTKILLARVGDKCYAVGASCTHYGAPLVEGALVEERIVCPWHHACFHAATGDLLEPPALDALPNYPVKIEGDDIFVELPDEPEDRRTPEMSRLKTEADNRVFVILGGGAAGYTAAQTLRGVGFKGRVVMITRETHLPYDRPNLSKDYLQGHAEPEWMPLRAEEFFDEHDIEILREKEVVNVEVAAKTIAFKDGKNLRYDNLLVATGGTPRKLDLPNSDLKNIFVLRSFDDADWIIEAARGAKSAVVIGASFIGMEAAFSLRERGIFSVTVVAPDKVPFEKTLGFEIGEMFQKLHEYNGVKFRLGASVKGFEGDGKVEAVILDSGEHIETDLVIVGVGVKPATDFLEGVELHKDGGIITDEFLRAGDDFYAAGDIVHFPDARTGENIRVEHWRYAMQQGRAAARNMTGKQEAFTGVPFFWTMQFDAALRYIGHAKSWDEIIFQGDVREQNFLAFYVKDNRVLAVAGINRDREMAILEELMRLNRIPSPERLRNGAVNFLELSEASSAELF